LIEGGGWVAVELFLDLLLLPLLLLARLLLRLLLLLGCELLGSHAGPAVNLLLLLAGNGNRCSGVPWSREGGVKIVFADVSASLLLSEV
jgi:hypothetical protein